MFVLKFNLSKFIGFVSLLILGFSFSFCESFAVKIDEFIEAKKILEFRKDQEKGENEKLELSLEPLSLVFEEIKPYILNYLASILVAYDPEQLKLMDFNMPDKFNSVDEGLKFLRSCNEEA